MGKFSKKTRTNVGIKIPPLDQYVPCLLWDANSWRGGVWVSTLDLCRGRNGMPQTYFEFSEFNGHKDPRFDKDFIYPSHEVIGSTERGVRFRSKSLCEGRPKSRSCLGHFEIKAHDNASPSRQRISILFYLFETSWFLAILKWPVFESPALLPSRIEPPIWFK